MNPCERALRIIALIHVWKPGEPSRLTEGSPTDKAAMIAKWGLEGDHIRLAEAELHLGVIVDE